MVTCWKDASRLLIDLGMYAIAKRQPNDQSIPQVIPLKELILMNYEHKYHQNIFDVISKLDKLIIQGEKLPFNQVLTRLKDK